MDTNSNKENSDNVPKNTLLSLIRPYLWWILSLLFLTIIANALNLAVPKIIQNGIDNYSHGNFDIQKVIIEFFLVALFVLVFTYLQGLVQTFTAERVARDLRTKLIDSISRQSVAYIQNITPAKLLTNLTSDVDAIKNFVAQAISSIISSFFLIIGAGVLLILIDWRLATAVLTLIPIIGVVFYVVFGRVRQLFLKAQESIDWLNKVINESILGAALVRLLNSRDYEYAKFLKANGESKRIGFMILRNFSILIPTINFFTNIATLIILSLGGHFVIINTMSLGEFTAFNNYLVILIFPVLIISFMSTVIAQASSSLERINKVLLEKPKENTGKLNTKIRGDLSLKNVSLSLDDRNIIKNVNLRITAGAKVAIIGPTAAGKTQLLYLLTGLVEPSDGVIEFDGRNVNEYVSASLHEQVAFVFQDSILFNLTLRENIAFSNIVSDESLKKAIETAELDDLINSLPEKLDTIVSERGTSLSGGQKQRLMLARALALDPKVLLLDDFTARVDANTEHKILKNISRNYPGLTLISVTQKIAPVKDYDLIILLMEGEVLARGKHSDLISTSPEYVQIYNSQMSTSDYELHPE